MLLRNQPQDWHFSDIALPWLKHREIFAADKTIRNLTVVCEELQTFPTKSTVEVKAHFGASRQVFAVACVRGFNIYTASEKDEMRKSKKGRKELREHRPQYQFLVWYLYHDDWQRMKDGGSAPLKNPVPISRMKEFFPTSLALIAPTQAEIVTTSS